MNETYTKCDGCGRLDCVSAPSAKVAAQVLRREGWLIGKVGAMCPTCDKVARDRYIESLAVIRAEASQY